MASLGAGAATPVAPVLTIPTAPSAGAAARGSDESMHTLDILDAASMRSDVPDFRPGDTLKVHVRVVEGNRERVQIFQLSLIHISEPTRRTPISYAVFCLKKKK